MTDADTGPGAPIPLATVANLRDLGGWRTTDGRQVAYGVVFRSTDLNKLSEPDRAALETLGVATVYDFRSVAERTTEPDVTLDGVQQVALDVLADAPHAVPGNLTEVLSDPAMLAAARSELGGRGVRDLMEGSYQQLVTLPSALSSYQRFFRGLLGDHPAPALFHCTTGKDRTGWAAASLLTLLGVPVEDVYREYLLTNDQLIPALEPIVTAFARAGGDPAAAVAGARGGPGLSGPGVRGRGRGVRDDRGLLRGRARHRCAGAGRAEGPVPDRHSTRRFLMVEVEGLLQGLVADVGGADEHGQGLRRAGVDHDHLDGVALRLQVGVVDERRRRGSTRPGARRP